MPCVVAGNAHADNRSQGRGSAQDGLAVRGVYHARSRFRGPFVHSRRDYDQLLDHAFRHDAGSMRGGYTHSSACMRLLLAHELAKFEHAQSEFQPSETAVTRYAASALDVAASEARSPGLRWIRWLP